MENVLRTRLKINGYDCEMNLDDGTYFPQILDADGKVLCWHYFDTRPEAMGYLHFQTKKLSEQGV